MAQTEDRRKKRTRTRLRHALLHLILEKPYDQITVQNILDQADVSRSAFYAHFEDKDALLLSGMPEDILSYGMDKGDTLIPSVIGIFAHVQEGFSWFQAMSQNDSMRLLSQMSRQRMVENWLDHLKKRQQAGYHILMPPTAVAHYLTGALTSLLLWWIESGMKQSPEEMSTMFEQLAGQGLEQLILAKK